MSSESIVLSNDLKELERLGVFLRGLSGTMGMDDHTLYQVNLVCDELVTNIILYGYPPDEPSRHTIRIDLGLVPGGWELRMTDRGVPFNPLLKSSPTVDLSLEDRGIGGLGIYFVKQVMDDIMYERLNGENVLMMKKWQIKEEGIS
ncbi:ATP-binding protein [Paenibacillus alginolyticus]|uniref:ATP-binding protein n=1 Tax=Paenibacillus alginolyticus TaxID=59839 RepID=A0ABT4G7L3_9BACL|nr:ATP-binding protein [Paenibacillus alginolyticus]MCY9668522.1 ATP-binding protein [Paenibacillus alginolyticus]MCY9692168.1 ATP-binding protein [Paenibacillus alginolyticus]MEC0148714.1 ATP-binding protein [Paenibacillus alginolyticus]